MNLSAANPHAHPSSEISPNTVPPNFDRVARIYRWLECLTFGPWLWRCRCVFLDRCADRRRALVLGDGDGRFAAALLARNNSVMIDAVDASFAMLHLLLRRSGPHRGRVKIHHTDIRAWEPPRDACDLIVTHFFLDCLSIDEVAHLARRLRPHANPDTIWIVSEFTIPRSLFGTWIARPLVTTLYAAFRLLTGLRVRSLPDHRTALGQAGFALVRSQSLLGGLLVSELWKPAMVHTPPDRALDGCP